MTCNDKCIHFPVCEQKKYDFANIDECQYYEEQRPHGEWKERFSDSGEQYFECSECGWLRSFKPIVCENCGADMREGEEVSKYEKPNKLKNFGNW